MLDYGYDRHILRSGVAVMDVVERREVPAPIVAHQGSAGSLRFLIFGFSWLERFCAEHGCEILVTNDKIFLILPQNSGIERELRKSCKLFKKNSA